MSLREEDRQVLEQLAANGDNPSIPRPVMHIFYGAREPIEEVAGRLEAAGWVDLELGEGEMDFQLVATKTWDLREPTVEMMMAEVEQAMADLDLDYDGWETSVEQPH